jgi:hypothetical protein
MSHETKNLLFTLILVAVCLGGLWAFYNSQLGKDIAGISSHMP